MTLDFVADLEAEILTDDTWTDSSAGLDDSSLSAAVLLAYDWVRVSSGCPQKGLSDLYVPNEAVIAVARRHSKFLPGASIHPARPDAFEELERCADQGAALLKLLPCVQNVDCSLFGSLGRNRGQVRCFSDRRLDFG